MAGSTRLPARRAFAESLKERLDGKDAEAMSSLGFKCLDDGVAGYIFDLVPLQLSLSAAKANNCRNGLVETDLTSGFPSRSLSLEGELQQHLEEFPLDPQSNDNITSPLTSLIHTSLTPLPATKPRIVNSATGPLELLRLIGEVGIDLFEAGWAVDAASIGVALDFQFPVLGHSTNPANGSAQVADEGRIVEVNVEKANGVSARKRIGHNLYEGAYTFDFSPLASCFDGAALATAPGGLIKDICPCAACSPIIPATRIAHDSIMSGEEEIDSGKANHNPYKPSFTRAYIYHLLHTHEMSAHALLVMHNVSVVERFLEGVREVIGSERGLEGFWEEVEKFEEVHPDEDREELMEEARKCWKEVDLARGRGRLKREMERQKEAEVVDE